MQDYYEELRSFILKESQIVELVLFDKLPFQEAVVENVIISLDSDKNVNKDVNVLKVDDTGSFHFIKNINQSYFNISNNKSFNLGLSDITSELKSHILNNTKPLGTFTSINQAIALKHDRNNWVFKEKINDSYKPLLVGGKNIQRYTTLWDGSYLKYDLSGIHSCKREDIFLSKEKILFRRVANRLIATIDDRQFYALHTIVVINNIMPSPWDLRFILALLNSKVLNWYYAQEFSSTKTVFTEIGARQVELLPIKDININEQKQIITLVNEILRSKENAPLANTLELENELDNLIYQLYNLTEDEIKLVEGVE